MMPHMSMSDLLTHALWVCGGGGCTLPSQELGEGGSDGVTLLSDMESLVTLVLGLVGAPCLTRCMPQSVCLTGSCEAAHCWIAWHCHRVVWHRG